MSVNTAIMVNAILDLSALGALAYVCRRPFRADAEPTERSKLTAHTGGAAAAAMNTSAR